MGRRQLTVTIDEKLVEEMINRGYKHHTPLDVKLATGEAEQTEFVTPYEEQVRILRERCCECDV